MIKTKKLTKSNIDSLVKLNSKCTKFNSINEDFFGIYSEANHVNRHIMKKNIKMIYYKSDAVGHIWYANIERRKYILKSFYVEITPFLSKDFQNIAKGIFKNNSVLIHNSDDNIECNRFMSNLGFQRVSSIREMKIDVNEINFPEDRDEVYISTFISRKDEIIRCTLQNKIFHSSERIPLSVDDIYIDEEQDYYIKDGSFFLMKDGGYIGYGQLVYLNNSIYLVNFGIVDRYRRKGYGEQFLYLLLKRAQKFGYNRIKIKVDNDNFSALNLYTKIGFQTLGDTVKWRYKVKY